MINRKTILTTAIAMMATLTATASNDSIAVVPLTPVMSAYPTIHTESDNDDVMIKIRSLRYNEAKTAIDAKMKQAKRRKESTAALERQLAMCTEGMNALDGTDRVLIVDSVVVDKQALLSAYSITPDLGTLTMSASGETVSYSTQINGMTLTPILVSDDDGNRSLAIARKYADENTAPQAVGGLGVDGDINYPFLLSDGQRFYFAARSQHGHGNYDLYATRYDNENKRFYRAENMGFPYNSYANDYMLVIDESNGVGWFASDRYQPEGKVCVYTFIPNESRRTINQADMTAQQLLGAASLHSIAALQALYTDDEKARIASARATVSNINQSAQHERQRDFQFVVDNAHTYHTINDFRSPKARQLCKQWAQWQKNLATLYLQLDDMRLDAQANRHRIVNTENRINQLTKEINDLAKTIRREEILSK